MRRSSFWRAAAVVTAALVAQPLLAAGPVLAADGDGSVVAWGFDDSGQLGDGAGNRNQRTPVPVSLVAAGIGVVEVAAGGAHSLALRTDGSVLSWGDDGQGQLGDGASVENDTTPVSVAGLDAGSGVVAVAAGGRHSLALKSDGTVLAWGDDLLGQLGDGGAEVNRQVPVEVSGLGAGSGVVAVAAGESHSLAVKADGTVLAWGSDVDDQLGDGGASRNRSNPIEVLAAGSGVADVSAGGAHSLARKTDGTVLAWGSDAFGQIGNGPALINRRIPTAVDGLTGVAAISAGGNHSLAALTDGSVQSWGADGFGQLGDGFSNVDQPTPVPVLGLGVGSGVVGVSAGRDHSLALRADGGVLAWGADTTSQLGDGGTNTNMDTPVAVSGLGAGSGVTIVSAGSGHSLAAVTADPVASTFTSLSPERLWDTRNGPGPMGKVGAGQTRTITVAGFGDVPPTGATAVALNVTATGPTAGTFITVFPAGEDQPNASNLNVPPNDTRPNFVIVKLGDAGAITFFNEAGDVDLIADVAGYYSAAGGEPYKAVSPVRVWDSRSAPGPTGQVGAGDTRDITVTGFGGVPAHGASAVVLNVTATNASAGTFVTVFPTGEDQPVASNLNLPPGDTRPNLVIVKVGAGGQVTFYNDAGNLDLIADIAGWYGPAANDPYTPVSPARVWDSRSTPGPTGLVGPGQTRDIKVTEFGGVPATGVSAVVLNVTATNASAGTFVTVFPTGEDQPVASNLNLPPGDTRPNLVIVKVGAGGQVTFYNDAGNVNLIADVAGWYGFPPLVQPG